MAELILSVIFHTIPQIGTGTKATVQKPFRVRIPFPILQIKLAKKYNLPIVIHTREATEDTYEILKKYDVKGVLHCYSGSLEMAKLYMEKGYMFGIGGVLTFKNSKLKDVIKEIPAEETLDMLSRMWELAGLFVDDKR